MYFEHPKTILKGSLGMTRGKKAELNLWFDKGCMPCPIIIRKTALWHKDDRLEATDATKTLQFAVHLGSAHVSLRMLGASPSNMGYCPQNSVMLWMHEILHHWKPWLKQLFFGIYRGIMKPGFLNGAKWISSTCPAFVKLGHRLRITLLKDLAESLHTLREQLAS